MSDYYQKCFVQLNTSRLTILFHMPPCLIRFKVRSVSIVDFFMKHVSPYDHNIFKLDVEGAEYDILQRLVTVGFGCWIKEAILEFHATHNPKWVHCACMCSRCGLVRQNVTLAWLERPAHLAGSLKISWSSLSAPVFIYLISYPFIPCIGITIKGPWM